MRALFDRQPEDVSRFFLLRGRTAPSFPFIWHYHREYEINLTVRGRGRRFVGDSIESYQEGDVVLLGPGLPHSWCSFPDKTVSSCESRTIRFGDEVFGPWRSDGLKLGPVRDLLARSAQGIRFDGATQQEIAARMMGLAGLSPLRQLAELFIMLDVLARSQEGTVLSSRTFSPELWPGGAHPLDKVYQLLNERYLGKVTLGAAARVLGMSPSSFSSFFHRSTGKTFTGYINELRLGRACQLLMETDRTIVDVAGASGFSNLSHFNHRFLRWKKMTPSQYRKECRRFQVAPRG